MSYFWPWMDMVLNSITLHLHVLAILTLVYEWNPVLRVSKAGWSGPCISSDIYDKLDHLQAQKSGKWQKTIWSTSFSVTWASTALTLALIQLIREFCQLSCTAVVWSWENPGDDFVYSNRVKSIKSILSPIQLEIRSYLQKWFAKSI